MKHDAPQSSPIFWSAGKIRVFCLLVLAGLSLHIAWIYFSDINHTSLLRRGDFASFYSAGMMVRQQLGKQLYDTQLLAYVQNLYWPSLHGSHISFPYPPFMALALKPFAYFPPQTAKLIFTLLMISAAGFAVKLSGRFAPLLSRNRLGAGVFLLAFFPVSFGILGSQFTAVNMLLCAGLLNAHSRGTKDGEIWTGICLGLWCFKPQYACVLLLFFLAARRWRVVFPALSVGAFYYGLGVMVQGWAWPWSWIQAAAKAAAIDFPYNDFNMISLTGFFHAAGRVFAFGEKPALALSPFSWVLSAGLIAWTGFLFWKAGNLPEGKSKNECLQKLLLMALPVLLLASPHALFYDLGICVITCAGLIKLDTDRKIWIFILLTLTASLISAFKGYFPLQPLIFYALAAFWLALRNVNSGCEILQFKAK